MFYAAQLVSRDGPLQVLWVAATLDRQLNRQLVDGTAIPRVVEVYLAPDAPDGIFSAGPAHGGATAEPGGRNGKAGRGRAGPRGGGEAAEDSAPLALRLSGQLLLGVCRIYSRKVTYLLQDCEKALLVLKNICPTDAPLAYGDEEGGSESTRERHRTHHGGGGEGGADGADSRRTARQRRKTLAAGTAAAAAAAALSTVIGPDGEPRMLPYDEDDILLSGAAASQGPDKQEALDLLGPASLGRAYSLDDDDGGGAGPSSGLPFATPRGRGSFSLRDPWSTPWTVGGTAPGAGFAVGSFSDPHPAATDDRHAYFDDEMPDHFEFDLHEHEIEALRAASHDLDLHQQQQQQQRQQQPMAADPFATPPAPRRRQQQGGSDGGAEPVQKQPRQEEEEQVVSEGQEQDPPPPSPAAATVTAVTAADTGDEQVAAAMEDDQGEVERGEWEQGSRSRQEQAEEGLERGHLRVRGEVVGGEGEGGPEEPREDRPATSVSGGRSGYGGGVSAIDDDDKAPGGVSEGGQGAGEDGPAEAGGEAGAGAAVPPTLDEDAQMAEAAHHDGEAEVGDSTPRGGSLADPETLPGGATAGTSADAAPRTPAARSAIVQLPGDAVHLSVALPGDAAQADGAQTPGGAAQTPTTPGSGGRRRGGGSGGDGTPRVCVDVERDGRVKTALSSHSVRELLQDRGPLIDHRRRYVCQRRRTPTAATAIRDAHGSPWLVVWGRFAGNAVHPGTAAEAAAASPRGHTRSHDAGSRDGPSLAQYPLDVASGPATLPAAALAPSLQLIFRFLAGRAGSGHCDQLLPSDHLAAAQDPELGKGKADGGRAGSARTDKAPGKRTASSRSRSQTSAPASTAAAAGGGGGGVSAAAAVGGEGDVDVGVVNSGGGGRGGGDARDASDGPTDEGEVLPSQDLVPPDAELPDLEAGENLVDGGAQPAPGAAGIAREEEEDEEDGEEDAEGEEQDEEEGDEEEPIAETKAGEASEYFSEGEGEAAGDSTGDEQATSEGGATTRRRRGTDGFTARTQAVLRKLQAMALSARRTANPRGPPGSRSAKRRRREGEAAEGDGDGPLQLTTAAELLMAVADLADPAAAARRRNSSAGHANDFAAAAATPGPSHASGGAPASAASGGDTSPLKARVSRMAAARTFYDLLVLSNRGYISLVTHGSGAGGAEAGLAATASGAGGGSGSGGGGGASGASGASPPGARCCGIGCEELVLVARRRLEEQIGSEAGAGGAAAASRGGQRLKAGGAGRLQERGPQQRQSRG